MKKVFLNGIESEEALEPLLRQNDLEAVSEASEAEVLLYKSDFDQLLEMCGHGLKARAILSLDMLLMNNKVSPIDLKGQSSLGKRTFNKEDIRGVTDKISDLIDSLDFGEQFSEISRFMKMNAIELVQNSLIHKRLTGKEGIVQLEVFETTMFYNIRVTDSFGALTKEEILAKTLRASMEKTYEKKESGAGLGLYMAIRASDCVVFRIKSGKQTQVCCIINKYKRLKQYKSKSPALFIFEE